MQLYCIAAVPSEYSYLTLSVTSNFPPGLPYHLLKTQERLPVKRFVQAKLDHLCRACARKTTGKAWDQVKMVSRQTDGFLRVSVVGYENVHGNQLRRRKGFLGGAGG